MRQVIQIDQTVLKQVLDEARERIKATEQWGWGNALEKAAEELRDEPAVEVEVEEEPEQALALIYPPHERIGVTYYVQSDRCQCEAFIAPSDPDDPESPPQKRPCRHRAKLRLIERVVEGGGAHPVRTEESERATGQDVVPAADQVHEVLPLPVPPVIGPPQDSGRRRSRRNRKRAV